MEITSLVLSKAETRKLGGNIVKAVEAQERKELSDAIVKMVRGWRVNAAKHHRLAEDHRTMAEWLEMRLAAIESGAFEVTPVGIAFTKKELNDARPEGVQFGPECNY